MRNAPTLRAACRVLLAAGCVACTGCTHNYYYGGAPACVPGSAVPGVAQFGSSVQYGNVCEVPTKVLGGTNSAVAESTTPVVGAGGPPRVVISEPLGSGPRQRFAWKAADPDGGPAITRVEGAVNDDTTTR